MKEAAPPVPARCLQPLRKLEDKANSTKEGHVRRLAKSKLDLTGPTYFWNSLLHKLIDFLSLLKQIEFGSREVPKSKNSLVIFQDWLCLGFVSLESLNHCLWFVILTLNQRFSSQVINTLDRS